MASLIPVSVRRVTAPSGKQGPDLNEVAREVLRDAMRERGATNPTQIAKALGQPQRTIDRLMSDEGSFSLTRLSEICAELDTSVVEFFASHEEFALKAKGLVRLERDALSDRFNALLSPPERKALLDGIEELRRLGSFGAVVAAVQGMVDAAKKARQKAIRDSREISPKEA